MDQSDNLNWFSLCCYFRSIFVQGYCSFGSSLQDSKNSMFSFTNKNTTLHCLSYHPLLTIHNFLSTINQVLLNNKSEANWMISKNYYTRYLSGLVKFVPKDNVGGCGCWSTPTGGNGSCGGLTSIVPIIFVWYSIWSFIANMINFFSKIIQ